MYIKSCISWQDFYIFLFIEVIYNIFLESRQDPSVERKIYLPCKEEGVTKVLPPNPSLLRGPAGMTPQCWLRYLIDK